MPLQRLFCSVMGAAGNHGIEADFLWCWGVFSSLTHFSRSGGGVPPRAACRWAHVWRNEPRAISHGVCHLLPAFCLPLAFFLISVPSSSPPLIIPSIPIMHLSPAPVAVVSWGLWSLPVKGGLCRRLSQLLKPISSLC